MPGDDVQVGHPSLLMLSPCPHNRLYGGVQRTAELGWTAVEQCFENPRLLCFGKDCVCPTHPVPTNRSCAKSIYGAILRAAGASPNTGEILLVWHLGMLKLLPFIRGTNRKVVLFLHGIECWIQLSIIMRRLAAQVDCFLSNSDFTWQRFIQLNPQFAGARHRTVHLGDYEPPADVPSPSQRCAALMIGRMALGENYKGHMEVIRAWPAVLRQIPGAELWIAGGGDLELDLRTLAANLGLKNNVRFHGVVSEGEKQELVRQSRCLALPSRGEGFGLVYLEAMRFGKPCLVSNCDAGKEVVNPPEAGLAVDPLNQRELEEALVQLLTNAKKWSVPARRRYESQFTASIYQQRLVAALKEV